MVYPRGNYGPTRYDASDVNNFCKYKGPATDFGLTPQARITPEELDMIANKLRKANIVSLSLHIRFGSKEITHLAEALGSMKSLTRLDVSQNARLGDKGAVALAGVLNANESLIALELCNTSIGVPGLQAVTTAIIGHPSFKSLDFSFNEVGSEIGRPLAELLGKSTTLTTLGLQSCDLSSNGAKLLIPGLKNNNTLVSLNLVGNRIGGNGTKAIANVVPSMKSLTSIDMNGNMLEAAGVAALCRALKKNRALLNIGVKYPTVTREEAARINALIKRNTDLKKNALLEALNTGEKAPWCRSKLMVIGEGMVGKTATVRALLHRPYDPNWNSTVGVDLTETRSGGNGNWQSEGIQEYTQSFIKMIIARPDDAGKLVQKLHQKLDEERENDDDDEEETTRETPAQQLDEEEAVAARFFRSQDRSIQRAYEQERNQHSRRQQSSDDDIRVSIWDYGGQEVFQTLHHLFLTSYGVYLLIFALPRLQVEQEESLEYLRFWLNSVKMHAPHAPVIMVGTFLDDMKETALQELHNIVQPMLKLSFPQVVNGDFLAIDNKSGHGVTQLRRHLDHVTRQQEFVYTPVSMQWTRMLDWMFRDSKTSWVRLAAVKKTGVIMGITSAEELLAMLELFHELGVVLYFSATASLAEIVTVRPQWLINSFSKVIRDHKIHALEDNEISKAGLFDDVAVLFSQGLVSLDLLHCLWKREQVGFLLDLMRHLLLLSDWNFDKSNEMYLVPSMVVATNDRSAIKGVKCVFWFEFLPNGVYERLVCLCVDYCAYLEDSTVPELFKSVAVLYFQKDSAVYLERQSDRIVAYIEDPSNAFSSFNILLSAIRKLKTDVMGNAFEWNIMLEVEEKMIEFETVRSKSLAPWFAAAEVEEEAPTQEIDFSAYLENF